jgi:hypothetical protein
MISFFSARSVRLRSLPVFVLVGFLAAGLLQTAWALDPRVEALGNAALVLEEETTVLNLFNLGNPAGAVLLPRQNRVDTLLEFRQRERLAEFATGDPIQLGQIDVLGNTLLPSTEYTRRTATFSAMVNDWGATGYGGVLQWLNETTVVQIIPQGQSSRTFSPEFPRQEGFGGGRVRVAFVPVPQWAIGAGVSGAGENVEGWNEPEPEPLDLLDPTGVGSHFTRQTTRWQAELGGAWSNEAVFDPQDRLELGFSLTAGRPASHTRWVSDAWGFSGSGGEHVDLLALPWEAQLQGVYDYQSVMDVALVTGWQACSLYRSVTSDDQTLESQHLAAVLSNFDYSLSFRVRLPMVRKDDLRFGVTFDNRGLDSTYPTGIYRTYRPDGLYAGLPVETLSSSIGIGTAIVPDEGSIIALEYHLGSSKSRTTETILANSGFTRFGFGAQYSLLEGLFLRFGYANERVTYQTAVPKVSNAVNLFNTETSSFRFGVGLEDGPFRLDLTTIVERVANSPDGWTMLDKPLAAYAVTQDQDHRWSTLCSFTWLY